MVSVGFKRMTYGFTNSCFLYFKELYFKEFRVVFLGPGGS